MNQKGIVILFFTLVFIGLAVGGYSQFKEGLKVNPSPSASPTPNLNLDLTAKAQTASDQGVQVKFVKIGDKLVKQFSKFPGSYPADQLKNKAVVVETSKGKIVILIFPENPKAASNFLFLVSQQFYDGLTFHRVEAGFVVQGGDPLGNGTGDPGYTFVEDNMIKGNYAKGAVAMAKKGNEIAGTGGSQFFIMLENKPLSPDYVIFGKVVQGMEIVEQIAIGDVMQKLSIVNVNPTPSEASESANN